MNFKNKRLSLGYTQSEIAPLLGVSVSAVQSYERNGGEGKREPSKSVLMLLERVKSKKF